MAINPVGIFQQDRGISYGDLLWGQLGHLLFLPSSWEAAAYHFGGNSGAKLSTSNASCMPPGDPGKAYSSLGKCSLDHPFLIMSLLHPKRSTRCQVEQLKALLDHLLMTSHHGKSSFSPSRLHTLKDLFFSIVPTSVEIHLHPHILLVFNHSDHLLLFLPQLRASLQ